MHINDLLIDGNTSHISNLYHICHRVQDINCRSVHDLDLDLEWAKVKCKYVNRKPIYDLHVMAIVIFTLSVTIFKIFIVGMCVTLTLTFRMGQG